MDLQNTVDEEDRIIIDLLKENNQQGLRIAFDKYYISLTLFADRILNDIGASEDIVQTLFIKLWEAKLYRNISGSLKSYLTVSVRNSCINYIKKQKVEHERLGKYFDDSLVDFNSNEIPSEKEIDLIYKALEELPPHCKATFCNVFLDGLSYKETAQKMEVSVNTVKTQLARACSYIRNKVRPQN